MTKPVFRFAPSPNGRLHLGHAYSALLNADLAKRLDGRLLLRIEDIDLTRCRPEFVSGILDDLAWLGLSWEEPVRKQSHHFDAYRAAAGALQARGLLYPCFCSRRAVADVVAKFERTVGDRWQRDPEGGLIYPGTCKAASDEASKRIASGEPAAWRIDMQAALTACHAPLHYACFETGEIRKARPDRWGDAVIVRKDTPTSYHLSVVIDDAVQGVTHVVRGKDLEAATDLHVMLQRLLGLPTPSYHHHDLITDRAGEKLAKSQGSQSLTDLRDKGWTGADVRARLGFPR